MKINLKNKKKFSNFNKLFDGRNYAIKSVDHCSSVIYEAKRKVVKEELEEKSSKVKTKWKKNLNLKSN